MQLIRLPGPLVALVLASIALAPRTSAFAQLRLGSKVNGPARRQVVNNDPYEARLPDDLPQWMGLIFPDPSEALYPGESTALAFR
jgi:hypothetical protein